MKIDITLPCTCGNTIQAKLGCPEPDYFADRNKDSCTESDDYLVCDKCGADYEINIMNSFGGANVSANYGSARIHFGTPYFDEEDTSEWYWKNDVAEHEKILTDHLEAASQLLTLQNDPKTRFILQVMIYGHVVAAIEGFLSSVFIRTTTSSEELIRRLIESDPNFSEMKFTMSQIFTERAQIKDTVSKHLHEMIFHDLKKIKPMYQSVLGHDFGDIAWLFKAVSKRHHCVHRAGYDKEGSAVAFEEHEIEELIKRIRDLSKKVVETTKRLENEFEDPF